MKLSISVPDDLWARVRREDESPSRVVQAALHLLARERQGTADLIMEIPGVEAAVDDLTEAGRGLRRTGLEIGAKAASSVPWNVLEGIEQDALEGLEVSLCEGAGTYGVGEALGDALMESLEEEGLASRAEWTGEEQRGVGATISAAIIEGIEVVRSEVRRRLSSEVRAELGDEADGRPQ